MSTELASTAGFVHTKLNPLIECALRDGIHCKMAGDYNSALTLFNQVLESEPSNVRALISKGNIYDLQGNYPNALNCYNLAIESDSGNAEAWFNKGVTLNKSGDIEEGMKHIQRGVSLAIGEI
jgi:tetratricopeptide (TPR) repeat protein